MSTDDRVRENIKRGEEEIASDAELHTLDDLPRMINRVDYMPGGKEPMTVQELIDWCMQRGLDVNEVRLTGGHIRWQSPETDHERRRRENAEDASAVRLAQWERQQYERLKDKFES